MLNNVTKWCVHPLSDYKEDPTSYQLFGTLGVAIAVPISVRVRLSSEEEIDGIYELPAESMFEPESSILSRLDCLYSSHYVKNFLQINGCMPTTPGRINQDQQQNLPLRFYAVYSGPAVYLQEFVSQANQYAIYLKVFATEINGIEMYSRSHIFYIDKGESSFFHTFPLYKTLTELPNNVIALNVEKLNYPQVAKNEFRKYII